MSNFKKIVICSDSHGDKRDARAVRLLNEFIKDYKPNLRIHLGDFMDCEALRTGATEHERRAGLRKDRDAAIELFRGFVPTHVLWGNHDDRLVKYAKYSPGPMGDYCEEIIASVHAATPGATHFPYDKRKGVLRIGKMSCLHGFFSGSSAPQQTARAYGSCVFGHVHRFSTVSVPGDHGRGRAVARGVGCLCGLDQDYNSRQVDTLSQAQGWLYGLMDKRGCYWLANAEVIDGKVAVADNFHILG